MKRQVSKLQPEASASLTCIFCGKVLSSIWCLEVHINTHTGERPYNCSFCSATFNSRANEITHVKNLHLGIKYNCPKCRKVFNAQSNLIHHRKKCTGIISHARSDKHKKTIKKKPRARVTRRTAPILTKHSNNSILKKEPVIKEEEDDNDISTDDTLVETGRVEQEEMKTEPIPVQPVKPYNQASLYNQIQNMFETEKQHQQRLTGYFLHMNRYKPEDSCFSEAHALKSVTSDSEKASSVKEEIVVPKVKKPKNRRLQKRKINTSKRQFKKVAARKSISTKRNYLQGSHKCRQCGRFYSSNANLRRHKSIHLGIKCFICYFCKKGFVEKCNLTRHIAAMHQYPDEPGKQRSGTNRCGFCGEKFVGDLSKLQRHITTDHGEMVSKSTPENEDMKKETVNESTMNED